MIFHAMCLVMVLLAVILVQYFAYFMKIVTHFFCELLVSCQTPTDLTASVFSLGYIEILVPWYFGTDMYGSVVILWYLH